MAIHRCFLCQIEFSICLSLFTLLRTSSLVTLSSQLIFSILLYIHISKASNFFSVCLRQRTPQHISLIQIWTAVECNGAIYFSVVTSYCPRPKLHVKPSYFPRAFRPVGNMRVEGVIFGRGQYDVTTVQ